MTRGLSIEELKAVLSEVVDALPDAERVVINALFWERMTPAEVAQLAGVHRSTVVRVRDRAMDMIRRLTDD